MADEDPKPTAEPTADADGKPRSARPEDELKAAFDHLKSAAGLFFDRIAKDESLKKAADEATTAVTRAASGAEKAIETVAKETEKAIKTLGERAEPVAKTVAKEIGDELGRVARTVSSAFAADPIPTEDPKNAGDAAAPAATDPDDPEKKHSGEAKEDE